MRAKYTLYLYLSYTEDHRQVFFMVARTKDDRDSIDQHLASAIVVAAGDAQRMYLS